jgi:hypothetical protein
VDLDHSLPWLALRLTPGLGARLAAKLLRHFGSPEEIFRASLTELEACQLPVAAAQATFSKAAFRDAEKELAQVRKGGCRLIHWEESDYPKRLLEIYDPPPLLYVRGNEQVLNRHTISIVGTRRLTPCGNQIAERLARDLAEHGLIVASGLARNRQLSPPRRLRRFARRNDRRPRLRYRDRISEREPEALRGGREARRDHYGISDGDLPRAGEFSGTQPHGRGHGSWE